MAKGVKKDAKTCIVLGNGERIYSSDDLKTINQRIESETRLLAIELAGVEGQTLYLTKDKVMKFFELKD